MIWNEAVLHYIREALSFFAGAVIQLHAEADAAEAAGRALEIVRALGACDSPANICGKDFWAGMAGKLECKSPSEASRHILQELPGAFPDGVGADRLAHAEVLTELPAR